MQENLSVSDTLTAKRLPKGNRVHRFTMTEERSRFERQERQIAALCDLWRAVPHTDVRHLLQMITERATSALDGHTCSLLLRERGGDTLRVGASVGLPQDIAESVMVLVGERIAGRVAATGQAILVGEDPRQHPLLAQSDADGNVPSDIAPRPELQSALCAPLIAPDGTVLGVLCLSRYKPALPFTEGDLQIVTLFSAQAAAVIAQNDSVRENVYLTQKMTDLREESAAVEREMVRNTRLAALGHVAAAVAHELRNPLSSIKGAAQYLLKECDEQKEADPDTLRDFLRIVVDEVNGLSDLTTDLLEFARPSPPQRSRQDLAVILRNEVAFLRPELQKMDVLSLREVYAVTTPAWAEVDAAQVGRALRNLLLNAAQAGSSTGEKVRITVSLLPYLAGESDDAQQGYILSVEDNGPGIPAELRERIWEPFFTTKVRGTGLGLSQVRQVAETHNGEISLGETPGGGARFTLRLPSVATGIKNPTTDQDYVH